MFRTTLYILLACTFASHATSLAAQSSASASASGLASNNQETSGKTSNSSSRAPSGGNGGRPVQDWSTLMMLVSQTVDPDEWRDFGGTGNSTMLPYPNGVWIDAQGQMKRMQHRADVGRGVQSAAAHQNWLRASGLRTVSLKKLDAAIQTQQDLGLSSSRKVQSLAGLSHIEYVLVDSEQHDLLVAGPADGNASILDLEDLCLLLNVINDHTSPFGCSLDPSDKGLHAAAAFLQQPNTVLRLGKSPQIVADQLKKQVGPHQVNMFGIEPKCSTALALVNADELMKRYGLGLAKGPIPIKTYFDHLSRAKALKPQSLIRWWFAYTDQPVVANTENVLFHMPKQAVSVLSQEQWIAATGTRQPTGQTDPAAEAFAREFTEKYVQLAASEPAFARVEGIFELGLALQLAISSNHETSLHNWFPHLCHEAHSICLNDRAPAYVEGVTAHDRLSNGTVVAVISGGVSVDPAAALAHRQSQPHAYVSKPSQLKSADHNDQWWWD